MIFFFAWIPVAGRMFTSRAALSFIPLGIGSSCSPILFILNTYISHVDIKLYMFINRKNKYYRIFSSNIAQDQPEIPQVQHR